MSDIYQSSGKTIYLMLLFHQHQPFYYDQDMMKLVAPWVRTHTTKDYLFIPSLLKKYPNVHITINLSPSLLVQVQEKYVKGLKKFIDIKAKKIRNIKNIPEIETLFYLLIKPTKYFTKQDILCLYHCHYSALSVNEVIRHYFPECERVYQIFNEARQKNIIIKNTQLLRELKFWFTLMNFNLDILEGPVKLPDNTIIDLSDLVSRKSDNKYYLNKKIDEQDCERLFIETYRIMCNFLDAHKQLVYHPTNNTGQIELSTSPYSHPIVPLLYDTESAKECMEGYNLPRRFRYPEDAKLQVKMGLEVFEKYFGYRPSGIWPSEGAVSDDVVRIFAENKLQWFATDMQILNKTLKGKASHLKPYNVNTDGKNVVAFFRDTMLSDKIGFKYQSYDGEESADDFIHHLLSYADVHEEKVVSVILDGENAWEWYRKDFGAREFFNALFRKLEKLYHSRRIITVTPSEYLNGNLIRGISPHPIEELPSLKHISCGSWIHGDFSKWIGSKEKNFAWEVLLDARKNLENTGISFEYLRKKKKKTKKEKYIFRAYEYLFIAEGSDWFWWAGEDQESYTGKPFDELFLSYIYQIFVNLSKAGFLVKIPDFKMLPKPRKSEKISVQKIGTMKIGQKIVTVKFICDANDTVVPDAIYITGNIEELGEWIPNVIRMKKIKQKGRLNLNLWEYEVKVPEGLELHYKYTNSGKPGEWEGSEEFPALNRTFIVKENEKDSVIIKDKFGKL